MGEYFSTFSFRGLFTPELLVILFIVFLLYFYITRRMRHRFPLSEPQTPGQDLMFVTGLTAIYFGWGGPLYALGHMVFSVHMFQMVLVYILAVPLILLALPRWLIQYLYEGLEEKVPVLHKIVFHPVLGLLLFNALFSFYHMPVVFDMLMLNVGLHSIYEIALLLAAMLMWWHMLSPLPTVDGLSDLRRIGYVFANGLLITPACALIIFAGEPIYSTYTDPAVWSQVMAYCVPAGSDVPMSMFNTSNALLTLNTHLDQQLAGVLMKVMQEIAYGITIGYIFKQWLAKEKQQDGELSINDIPAHMQTSERQS
ncbi:putative membrane protein [Salsuginibacillus halophilus]|uniref:Putative membrane protein n=1 Tax=Salsuginibacillus halophilus TaxID=517424 RepID=A0A2P8HXJ1_9BACI|nr:cytochrome c oxidase assembly factor CtaG [Salsuginibacillus halophilus]PSL50946.1 putative membrane protein [Salsuginibacillus halophilus]